MRSRYSQSVEAECFRSRNIVNTGYEQGVKAHPSAFPPLESIVSTRLMLTLDKAYTVPPDSNGIAMFVALRLCELLGEWPRST